jgi:hypothetical protein
MHTFPGTVACFISGHDHDGGYAMDEAGIHHIVLPAPLECAVGEVAYGHIKVQSSSLHPSFFEFNWTGKIPPSIYKWPSRMAFSI